MDQQHAPTAPDKLSEQGDQWQQVEWHRVEARVFHTQREIHEAEKQGNHIKSHRLQLALLRSHYAKLLATRKATEDARGKDTPGTDGRASLTDEQKWRMATSLNYDDKPRPLRRTYIPKPGKTERRPLSIPTIRDRAIQHLIKLAIEPAIEAHLAPEQFGFRPGRGCHDAAKHLWLRLRKPHYVLDADISKFFDRLDHDAIIRAVPCPPEIKRAVHRLLKTGILDGVELTEPEMGTPQGGPLSPLLANIVLAGLPAAIKAEFPPSRHIEGTIMGKSPYIGIYADDFVVLHPNEAVIIAVKVFIETWLSPLGLQLHPEKTHIRHTAQRATDGTKGFNFLGFNFRHHRNGKHQSGKSSKPRDFLWIGPSAPSLATLRSKCHDIIKASGRSRKRRGAILDQARKGKATPEDIMVHKLNHLIRGWTGYHKSLYAKKTFSDIDNWLHHKLWKWARRQHPTKRVDWIKRKYFNNARPWRFTFQGQTGKTVTLLKASDTAIQRHVPVKAEESWYNGNWAYWSKRTGHYPMLQHSAARMIRRQHGKCHLCKSKFLSDDAIVQAMLPTAQANRPTCAVVHRHCAETTLPDLATFPVFVSRSADRSPLRRNSHAGFEVPSVSRDTEGATNENPPGQLSQGG